MDKIAILIILICVYLLVSNFLKQTIKPVTFGMRKKYEEGKQYSKSVETKQDSIVKSIYSRMPIIDLPEDDKLILNQKINRLGLNISVEEIRKMQLFYLVTFVVAGIIAYLIINKLLGIILIFAAFIFYKYPIKKINDEIDKRNEAVRRELPDLYNVLYYSFKRDINAKLTDKVRSYMKSCSELFYQEMMLFLDDARSGEKEALRQFKKRVPIDIVLRFCDIMENRLEGYDNIAVMTNFKVELDSQRSDKVNILLRDLENKLYAINNVGVVFSLTLLAVTYFGAMLFNTFK